MFRYFRYVSFSSLLFVSLFFPHRFPARTLPGSPTVITATENISATTWHNFTRLLDVEKGSHVSGISELKKYFHHFGYITTASNATSARNFTDIFDSDLENAISLYQKNLGLPVTGKLDPDTVTLITSPRCGVSDAHMMTFFNTSVSGILHKTKRYAYFSGKPRWVRESPVTLSYAFSKSNMVSYLNPTDIKTIFGRAFARWAAVIPLNFTETDDYDSADIKIGFYSGDHGDGQPFDGVLGVLAHAFSPENGRFHLDAAETWSVDFRETKSRVAVDLESVATHEIGHVLGLAHSSIKEAVMYPSLSPRTRKLELRVDDVEGIQALYGSNPNFSMSSLFESENSSNDGGFGVVTRSVAERLTVSLVLVALTLFLCS